MNITVDSQPIEEPSGDCRNCGKRLATVRWIGEGGSLALSHGHWASWCEQCALERQLEYAKERAESIPDLERRLKRLTGDA